MRILSLISLLTVFACTLSAQETTLLTPELLWKVGRVNLVDATSDGNYVLYSVGQPNIEANTVPTNTYLLDMRTQKVVRTYGKEAEGVRFTPDGKAISVVREAKLLIQSLTEEVETFRGAFQEDDYLLSPTGKFLLSHKAVSYFPQPKESQKDLPKTSGKVYDNLMYRHWKSYDDGTRNNYFLSKLQADGIYSEPENIINGSFHTPTKPFGDISEAVFSQDERFVVYTCKREANGTAEALSTNTDLFLYDIAAKKAMNITEGIPGYDKEPAFSPQGDYLLWTSMATAQYESDRPRLMVIDTKTNVRRDLTTKWPYEVLQPTWSQDGKTIYFLSAKDFTYQIFSIDIATEKIQQLTTGLHDYDAIKVTARGLVTTRHHMTQPNEVHLVDPKTGKSTQITQVNTENWGKIKKAQVNRETVTTTDGQEMNVWMVLPPDFDATKKYPTLLYCQGGPQSATSQFFSYRWNVQLMASQGYVVVVPCRRGMPGSGEKWNQAISGDWGGQAMQDLLSATDAAAKKPYVDADKIGAVGASFGGYSVYWLAGNHKKRFKSFISHCGLFNLESFYGTTEELFFAQHDIGKPYWEDPKGEVWLKDSPHKYVQNWDTPILVIHNELDYRVPIGEGLQAYQVAQLKGIKSKLLVFPDEGHHVTKPQNSLLWQRTFFSWLDETLKGNKP
jgi:dipeptidyl aminopeptidase/acylaminoacyl peptidase